MVIIFLLALVLRTYRLTDNPPGFHVDEVKVGWNAYSLLKTGRDDWNHAFPMYYDSFGDFRPTGYFYLTVASVKLFGVNEFAVRLPPAIFGSLSILILFFLVKLLTGNWKLALAAGFMLAVSPWQVSLSRASSESIISQTFILLGLYYLIKALKYRHPVNFIPALFFLIFSYFFYHIARLLVPLFVIGVSFYYPGKLLTKFFILCLVSLATLIFVFGLGGRGRFSQVSIFSDLDVRHELQLLPFEEGPNHVLAARIYNNKAVIYSTRFVSEYTQYLSSRFFLTPWEAKPVRYSTVGYGVTLQIEFLLIIIGLVGVIRGKFPSLFLLLLLLAPLPAALTTEDTPNLQRSLFLSPMLSVMAGCGLYWLSRRSRWLFLLFTLFLILNFAHFWHMYLVHNYQRFAITASRNMGVKELISDISGLQSKYTAIYFTDIPDSLYPWYAFYTAADPAKFNAVASNRTSATWNYENIYFTSLNCPTDLVKDQNLTHVLAVNAISCQPPNADQFTKIGNIQLVQGVPYTLYSRP